MKEFWNERYAESEYAYGKEPNEFLVAEHHRIKPGRVLCLAEGEGRNSAFLASKGFTVTAVDQSKQGLEKTKALGRELGVGIATIEADLDNFEIAPSYWDSIVSISAHLPPSIRKKVHRQVVSGIKPGGILILEAYTKKHLDMPGMVSVDHQKIRKRCLCPYRSLNTSWQVWILLSPRKQNVISTRVNIIKA